MTNGRDRTGAIKNQKMNESVPSPSGGLAQIEGGKKFK